MTENFMENLEEFEVEVDKVLENTEKEIEETLTDLEFFQNDIQELVKFTILKDLLNALDERLETHKDNNYLVEKYSNLKYMLVSSYTIDPLFLSMRKIKDKSKIIRMSADDNVYKKELKKLNTKLLKNKFSFLSIDNLYTMLKHHISENEARLFLYSLSRVVNSNGDKFLNTYSLFLNQLVKNIISLGNEDFEYRQDLIDNIKKYCDDLNN